MGLESKIDIYLQALVSGSKKIHTLRPPQVGSLRQTPHGELWIVDWTYSCGHRHGGHPLEKCEKIHPILDFKLADFNPGLATVIDTETTGLAGGTGTYAFIIGVGYWHDHDFTVRQYMMRDFNEEPAQLYAFAEDFTGSIITFNGKCFDLPLIANRYRLHRFESPFGNAAHLDMLFPCRRIWKRHLSSFKLAALEREILGFARVDDIPANLIPALFFDYLQNRDEKSLYPILHHNRDDIISLYQLTAVASQILERACENGTNDDDLLLSLAEIYYGYRSYERALSLLQKVNVQFANKPTVRRAAHLQAIALKRLGFWDKAIHAFLAAHEIDREVESLIESAKLLEHKKKDPRQALQMVHKAENLIEFESFGENAPSALIAELTHRKRRLLKKISKSI